MIREPDDVDVLVVGGGPAGLAAAIELRRLGVARVIVADREPDVGGIPRHSVHTGFGWRDLRRVLSGPAYAARYVQMAGDAGVELRASTTVTGWQDANSVALTSPDGCYRLNARAVILATGCRERPRAARMVPGDRPAGIFTTGSLQQMVYLQHQSVGRTAVVVGAEHVSYSALLTLAHGATRTVAMITEHARHQTYLPFKLASATRLSVPLLTSTRVLSIRGKQRVEAVELSDENTGRRFELPCDTVVFTGDWIADHELARRGCIAIDRGTTGPSVDAALRTSRRGVFAAGNLLHGAETADVAALSGRHAAASVQRFLTTGEWPAGPGVPIVCMPPLRWISPNVVSVGTRPAPPHGAFLLRVNAVIEDAQLVAKQNDHELWRQHYRRLVPNLPIRMSAVWMRLARNAGGPIYVQVRA
ncbi:MAG TPA: FAD-dependent oxidoreductase [Candidatus Acidoferrales bacterium]|nr:FAD-dependent oxidoreductase [Candidatus Acidoferrales bacterium]